jgi:hypothetical protein
MQQDGLCGQVLAILYCFSTSFLPILFAQLWGLFVGARTWITSIVLVAVIFVVALPQVDLPATVSSYSSSTLRFCPKFCAISFDRGYCGHEFAVVHPC